MKTLAFALTSGILVTALAPLASAQTDDDTSLDDIPHVTVIGAAHEDVAPDLAIITLGVVTERPAADTAADETARKAAAVIGAAKDLGIAPRDIQTQSLTLTQTFDPKLDADGHEIGQTPRGFEAANVVRIRIRDLAKAGAIAQTLIGKGANRFDGIDFSVEHPELVTTRLSAAAVRDAKDQASAAATAAGSKIGRALKIIRRQEAAFQSAQRPFAARAKAALSAPAMPIESGVETVKVEMEVTFALDAN